MTTVAFTVRRQYYDAIVAGTKETEIRKATKRWRTMAERATEAVFLCGRLPVHRRRLAGYAIFPSARAALGREPSDQGRADLGDGKVVVFYLGRVIERRIQDGTSSTEAPP